MERNAMASQDRRKFPTHLEHGVHALPLRVPNSTQPISRHGTRQQARDVRDNETERTSARTPQHAPERTSRSPARVRHALLPQHLLEDIAKLLLLRVLPRRLRARIILLSLPLALVLEEIPRPAEGGLVRASIPGGGLGEGVAAGRGLRGAAAAEELALAVVVAPSGGVGQGEVGVVDELELARAGGAFGGVGGDAVRVGLQGGAGSVLSVSE